MRGIGVGVGRWRSAFMVGLSLWAPASQAAEPSGPSATIGAPVIEMPTTSVVDPFQKAGVVPTPFVPYAARGTDLDPATRPMNVAPTPSPIVTSPPAIDSGDLVPVNLPAVATPNASVESAPKPRARKSTKTGAAKIEPKIEVRESSESRPATSEPEAAKPAAPTTKLKQPEPSTSSSAAMTPIRPASISRDVTPSPAVEEPTSTRPVHSPNSTAPQVPTNFSFPQPVIPLESALWRLLDVAGPRR